MSSDSATLKRGVILASIVVSSYAVFGHDAWAPEPARLSQSLTGSTGATAAAIYVNTSEPTTVLRLPGTWISGLYESGRACSPYPVSADTITDMVVERQGSMARCFTWFAEGARLEADLTAIGSTAPAVTLSTGVATTVVRFPTAWTYDPDHTVVAETYCNPWATTAGTAVGTFIIRFGDYARCSY